VLTIKLCRVGFEGRHGATALERKTTRKFEVDVEADFDSLPGETTDRLVDTVNYTTLAEAIVAIGVGEPHRLLESLARRMVSSLRQRMPEARRLRLELRKLHPPSCPGHPDFSAVRIDE
jgi:7,8-dihydroneopterin aldolase/epimerase/oxygenase